MISSSRRRPHQLAETGRPCPPGLSRLEPQAHHASSFCPAVTGVHGAGGGSGATTIASEIAWFLGSEGRNVAAIDSDLDRGCLHYRLDYPVGRSTFSLAEVLPVLNEISVEALAGALGRCPSGVSLLPAPPRTLDGPRPDSACASALVGSLRARFEHVVIDTRPAFDTFTAGLLASCDVVVLIVVPELACLGGARRALSCLGSLPDGGPAVRLVVNRSLGGADTVTLADLESFLGIRASAVLPEDGPRCRRLANECGAICSEKSALSREIQRFISALYG